MKGIIQLEVVNIALLLYRRVLLLYVPPHAGKHLGRRHLDEFLRDLYFKRLTDETLLIHSVHVDLGHNALVDGTAYFRVAAIALISMLNGCAHRHHWPQHFDIHDVFKYMPPISDFSAAVNEAMDIVRFVRQAIVNEDEVKADPEGSAEKN